MRNTQRGESHWGTLIFLAVAGLLVIGGVQYVKGKVTVREVSEDMRSEVITGAADHASLDSILEELTRIAADAGVEYREDDLALETGDQETVHLSFRGLVRKKVLLFTFRFPVEVDATGSGRLGVIGGDSGAAGGAMKSGLRGIQKAKDVQEQSEQSSTDVNSVPE